MNINTYADNRFLPVIAALVGAFTGAIFFVLDAPLFVVAAPGYLLLVLVFSIQRDWAMFALLLASFCTAIAVDIGPVTIRPDQIITIAIAPSIFLYAMSGQRSVVTTNLDFLIVAYLFCNFFSSFLNAPDPATSFQKCVLLGVTFLAYFVTTQLLANRTRLVKVIALFIAVGILEAVYGIISVVLFTHGIDIGGAHAPYGDLYARGTFLEGNIFGSFQMIIALVLMSFLLSRYFRETKPFIFIGLLVVLLALVMSFTRAAWIGFALGIFSYLLFIRREWLRRFLIHLPLVLIVCVIFAAIGYAVSASVESGPSNLMNKYMDRFTKLFEYQSGTGSLRLKVWVASLQFWTLHPVLGNGTDSIKALAEGTPVPKFGEEHWIPNSMLLALHDTGLVGFAVFCAIQIVFLWSLRRAMKLTSNPFFQTVLEGFFISFIAVQFTYFFTNAFWLIFIWVFMGIGTMCARHAMAEPE